MLDEAHAAGVRSNSAGTQANGAAVSESNALNEVVFMMPDRHVEHYIVCAREMRRQFMADLVRQARASLGRFVRRIIAKLSVMNNPVENIRDKAI